MRNKIVVLLSGGLDSAVVLALAHATGHECLSVAFDYGQANRHELLAAMAVATHFHASHRTVCIESGFWRGTSPLTGGDTSTVHVHGYVPGRNTLLLAFGLAVAEASDATSVHFGANADDADEYPDCRLGFVRAMSLVAALGLRKPIDVHAPLLHRSKRQVAMLAKSLAVPIELTTSCALSHPPCGQCRGCLSRQDALCDNPSCTSGITRNG